MSCDTILPELIGFHFGTLEPNARARVEAHLPECGACLRDFLAIKRDVELAEHEPLPSQAARDRLRRAVAVELQGPAARPWRWWERPFAFGCAALALLLAVRTVQAVSTTRVDPPRAFAHGRPAESSTAPR